MQKTTNQPKPNQKTTRAPAQAVAAQSEQAKQARETRIKSHNTWPLATYSQAERDFDLLISKLTPSLFLTPYQFNDGNESSDFHRHLGMLIDSLEMLPGRPDHAFDICFRVLDELSQQLTTKGTLTDALNGIGTFVCNNLASQDTWKDVINLLSKALPPVSGRYLAQRLLEVIPLEKDSLRSRAISALGQPLCDQLHKKYRTDLPNPTDVHISAANNRAGEFLCLLISQRTKLAAPPSDNHYQKLDLSDASNLLNEDSALSCLVSLLAFTARNERVHGSALSPFRSSKASLTTYTSYYYQFHLLYAVAVGLMIELFSGCGDQMSWKENVGANLTKYKNIFGKYVRKA